MRMFTSKRLLKGCLSAVLQFNALLTVAQIDATYPLNRMVFQRNNANQATVQVAGSFTAVVDRVEVQTVNRITQAVSGWTTVQANPTNGQFVGSLTLSGGWYQLNVRGMMGSTVVGTDVIERVGVGEVFAILGHSNAQGTSCGDGTWTYTGGNLCPTIDGAIDDRVSCARLNTNNSATFVNPAFDQYESTGDNRYLPGLTSFEKYDTYVGSAPFSRFAWFWGRMGDLLVEQLGVPVLLYNAGFGGSRMQDVYNSAYNIPFEHGFIRYDIRMPYINIKNIMNLYVPSTGLRAVLVQHGVNDRENGTETIKTHYLGVIDKVRSEFDLPNLSWIVSKDSYIGSPFQNVRDAQDAVINRGEWANPSYTDHIFPGPDLDQVVMYNPNRSIEENANNPAVRWRPDGLHYSPDGQREVAVRWSNVLGQSGFLTNMNPVLPQAQPIANIACPASGNQLTLGFPAGYEEYNWGDGTSNRSRTVSAGTYGIRLRATNNRVFFPPAVTVPTYVPPAQPVISAVGGLPSFCTTNSLSLTTNLGGPVRWSTNQTAPSIVVTSPGTYTAQGVNAVYGCLSAPSQLAVNAGQADLALSMAVDKRVLTAGDEVTYAITVTNKGPCDPGPFSWRDRLPANVQFLSSTDNLSLANNELTSSITAGLAPNSSLTQRFRARIAQSGYYLNAAEISTSTRIDPNSVANSGTADGQDDAATVDLRTVDGGSAVYASPNPNQTPLPAVQSNQPIPDPTRADLSVQLQASRRAMRTGQPVTFTLTVSNRGGATATGITVGQTLPAGLSFTASDSGMSVANGLVQGSIASLAAGQSATLTFVATANATGNQNVMAQIVGASPADSDSTPNNGYTNGEDDTAQVEVRVDN